MTKDNSAKDIITATSKEKPIASTFIVSLLENNNDADSASYYVPFTKTIKTMLTDGEDAIISVLKLKDKKEITLSGLAVFNGFKLTNTFNTKDSSLINLLNNFKPKTVFFEKSCKTGKTVISIYESDIKIKPNNDYVLIEGKLNARINEDNCNNNLKEEKTYLKLEKEFTKIITKDLNNLIDKLKLSRSNALSIGKNYYNKYRQNNYFLWLNQDFKYNLNLKINKKGLIFEVKE